MAAPTVPPLDPAPLRSRRRRAVVLVVLAIAALATAGTSASPQPPPLATASATGTLEVTPDTPMTSVVVTLEANDAARTVVGSGLVTRLSAADDAGAAGSTISIIEALDATDSNATYGSTASMNGSLDAACVAPQTCSGRYRITAILVDPEVKKAEVFWQASAELRAERPDRPSTAPEGTRLMVHADEPSTRPAADLARASVPVETVHLGSGRPLVSRFIDLEQPAGAPTVAPDRAWFAFLTTSATGAPDARPLIRLGVPGERGPLTNGQVGRIPFFPTSCEGDTRCTTSLRLDLGAPSGVQDAELDVSWSITVLSFGPPGTDPDPVGVRLTDSWDVEPGVARLHAATTGTFDISKQQNGVHAAIVTLDASTVAQGAGPITGFVQLTYEARAAATSGAGVINVGVQQPDNNASLPGAYGQLKPGAALTLVTQVVNLDCTGRSRCSVAAPFNANTLDAGPSVHVDWTVTAIWFPDRGAPVADGLALTIETSSPSPAP
jgi:hypothetical protein